MKILLIHPQHRIHRRESGMYPWFLRYAPLTMPTLAALVPESLGACVRVIDEMVETYDHRWNPDLVGITAITSTSARAYELADHYRRKGAAVVLGGVHPTLMTEEAAGFADAVVRGRAEISWPRLLHDFCERRLRPIYEEPEGIQPFSLPERRHIRQRKYAMPNTVEMSRGCPHCCEFCVTRSVESRYTPKDPVLLIREIKNLPGRFFTFLDPNIAGDPQHASDVFRLLAPLKKYWGGCASFDIMKQPDLLDMMIRAGCRGLLIGFESIDQQTLDAVEKPFNRVELFSDAIGLLQRSRVMVQGNFMFGFDTDGPDVFDRTVHFVQESRISLPQFTLYTPFPGTPAFSRMEQAGRIRTRNWSHYNGHEAVFMPKLMSPDSLREGYLRAWSTCYRVGSIGKRMARQSMAVLPMALPANWAFRLFLGRLSTKNPGQRN